MAKKKSTDDKAVTGKPVVGKSGKGAKKPEQQQTAPAIDTDAAARAAAGMLVARQRGISQQDLGGASVDDIKAALHKPANLTRMIDATAPVGQKKPQLPSGFGPQVGRNQTFGADVSRSYVPRRTGG